MRFTSILAIVLALLSGSALAQQARKILAPRPEDKFTIHCATLEGPNHALSATQLKDRLIRTSGMRDWHLVHGEASTELFYGYYKEFLPDIDRVDGPRAQADHSKIEALKDDAGKRLFKMASFVSIDFADPEANPKFNIENSPGVWSVEIASYKDSPERKRAAVESVKEARLQGIEAYYYHGPNSSSVLVGSWPQEAVSISDMKVRDGQFEIEAPKSGEHLAIVPPGMEHMLPPNTVAGDDRQRVQTFAPRAEPVDPSLIKVLQDFPHHALNGDFIKTVERDPVTGTQKERLEPSFIVKIPRRGASILAGDGTPVDMPPTARTPGNSDIILAPPKTEKKGVGGLKSFE